MIANGREWHSVCTTVVNKGIRLDLTDSAGQTALMLAYRAPNFGLVRRIAIRDTELPPAQRSVNIVRGKHHTPLLHTVAKDANQELQVFLLSCGANPNHTDVDGDTALHVYMRACKGAAAHAGAGAGARVRTQKHRRSSGTLNANDGADDGEGNGRGGNDDTGDNGDGGNGSGSGSGSGSGTRLDSDSDTDVDSDTASIVHVIHDYVASGINLTLLNKRHRRCALHIAAIRGVRGVVECLARCCPVAMEIPDAFGNTPLHHACMNGHVACVQALLALQAPVQSMNKRMRTQLHEAVLNNHAECARLLLEKGAHPYHWDIEGSMMGAGADVHGCVCGG